MTVYERNDRVGGLLRYGIPNMKLEKQIIDRKIAVMEEEGITFKINVDVGKDIKPKELLAEYDAVILACGASIQETSGAGQRGKRYLLCGRFF